MSDAMDDDEVLVALIISDQMIEYFGPKGGRPGEDILAVMFNDIKAEGVEVEIDTKEGVVTFYDGIRKHPFILHPDFIKLAEATFWGNPIDPEWTRGVGYEMPKHILRPATEVL